MMYQIVSLFLFVSAHFCSAITIDNRNIEPINKKFPILPTANITVEFVGAASQSSFTVPANSVAVVHGDVWKTPFKVIINGAAFYLIDQCIFPVTHAGNAISYSQGSVFAARCVATNGMKMVKSTSVAVVPKDGKSTKDQRSFTVEIWKSL